MENANFDLNSQQARRFGHKREMVSNNRIESNEQEDTHFSIECVRELQILCGMRSVNPSDSAEFHEETV